MIVEAALLAPAAAAAYAAGYSAWASARWPAVGRHVRVDGVRLHLIEANPDAPGLPVLALHGASSNAREWQTRVAPALGARRLIALDRPGYGQSDAPAGCHLLRNQARFAVGALDALGVDRALVLAHSLGAGAALRMALDYPDRVAGLVLLAPASHPYPGGNAWYVVVGATPVLGDAFAWTLPPIVGPLQAKAGIAGTFAPESVAPDYAEKTGLGLLFRPWTFAANARQVRATNPEFTAQAPRYSSITQPTVILTPDKDRVVSPKIHARALAAAIPGAELIVLDGAGHGLPQTRPREIADAVARVSAKIAAHPSSGYAASSR